MSTKFVTQKCAGFHKPLPKREHLRCEMCKGVYDLDCANVSLKLFHLRERSNVWKCPECLCKRPKVGNLNTPVHSSSPNCNPREAEHDMPPSPNTDGLQNMTVRSKLFNHCSHIILLTDFNVDLLKNTSRARQVISFLNQRGFHVLVQEATRVTDTTATLLDMIVTDSPELCKHVSVPRNPLLSDHALVVAKFYIKKNKRKATLSPQTSSTQNKSR